MRGCVESFLEVQAFSPVIYSCDQLRFTAMLFPECMLSIWQEFMFIQVCHNIWANNTPKTYPLSHIGDICLQVTIPLGISPVSLECWKRWANIGPSSDVSSFKTLGCSSSGPKAFEGFKPLRSFVTLSAETWMSSKKGAERLGRGTWVYVCFCWTHP